MRDDFSESLIIDKLNYKEFESKNIDSITKIIDLENSVMVELKSPENLNSLMLADRAENQTNIAVASAITAYARMYLNKFKNMTDNTYLGGDTDSIIMKYPLDSNYVGSKLGQFKLEHVITEGFYHSKKFYLLVTNKNEHIIKAKGIDNKKNLVNYNSFVELFKGNSIIVQQLQFNKDLKTLNVIIKYIDKTIEGVKDCDINYKMKNRNLVLYQPILPMVIAYSPNKI